MSAPHPITPREIVEELVEEIGRRRSARFASGDDTYSRRNPIASDVDPDSCKRRQVLSIVKGDTAKPFDEYLKARFEVGHLFEREAGRDLAGLGYDLIHQQMRFELSSRDTGEMCLTGKIDGKIGLRYQIEIPYETKSVHPAQWVRLKTIADLYRSRFYRKYVFQLTAYLLGHGLEVGFLWLTDCLGHWRAIIIEIDYELAERIWTFAEDVVAAVRRYRDDGTLPEYTENKTECGDCAFFGRSCQPEIPNTGLVMYKNGMLEAKLEELDELTENGKKYTSVRDKVKKWIKDLEADPELAGQEQIVVGDFVIEFTDRHRQGYTVEPVDYRQSKIRRVFSTPPLLSLQKATDELGSKIKAKLEQLEELEKPADVMCPHGLAQDMACDECNRSGFRFDWQDTP